MPFEPIELVLIYVYRRTGTRVFELVLEQREREGRDREMTKKGMEHLRNLETNRDISSLG